MKFIVGTSSVLGVKRVNVEGSEFLVVPVVAVVAGELNGERLSAEEIEKSVPGWEGKPVTLNHPKVNGKYVSARLAPTFTVGHLADVRFENDSLKANAYFLVGSDPTIDEIIANLESGGSFEVSTGYFANVGEDGSQHDLVPDHLAILPNEKGACSWSDGCGIPRVNSSCPCKEKEEKMEEDLKVQEEIEETVASEDVPEAADAPEVEEEVRANEGEETPEPEGLPAEVSDLLKMIEGLGGVSTVTQMLAELRANHDERRSALIKEIKANSGSFSDEELADMATGVLSKLATALRPASYGGKIPAPVTNRSEWEEYTVAQ